MGVGVAVGVGVDVGVGVKVGAGVHVAVGTGEGVEVNPGVTVVFTFSESPVSSSLLNKKTKVDIIPTKRRKDAIPIQNSLLFLK